MKKFAIYLFLASTLMGCAGSQLTQHEKELVRQHAEETLAEQANAVQEQPVLVLLNKQKALVAVFDKDSGELRVLQHGSRRLPEVTEIELAGGLPAAAQWEENFHVYPLSRGAWTAVVLGIFGSVQLVYHDPSDVRRFRTADFLCGDEKVLKGYRMCVRETPERAKAHRKAYAQARAEAKAINSIVKLAPK